MASMNPAEVRAAMSVVFARGPDPDEVYRLWSSRCPSRFDG